MKYNLLLGLMMALGCSACRLDNFMYNPFVTDAYLLDANPEPDPNIELDSSYDIPADKIHLFSVTSGPAGDQETIYGVYVGDRARIAQDTVIVYCHGNTGNLDYYWQRVKVLANVGGKNRFGVLIMDYRGYGMSTGTPTEEGLYYDVDACLQWLKAQGLTDERTILYGFSLGGAPSVELTAYPRSLQAEKIILEAAFASFDAITQDITKLSMPGSFYGSIEVDNAEKIKQVEEPLLWMHGEADAFMPYSNGEHIANYYQGNLLVKRPIAGAGHSTIPPTMGIQAYSQMIYDFILGN